MIRISLTDSQVWVLSTNELVILPADADDEELAELPKNAKRLTWASLESDNFLEALDVTAIAEDVLGLNAQTAESDATVTYLRYLSATDNEEQKSLANLAYLWWRKNSLHEFTEEQEEELQKLMQDLGVSHVV